MIKNSIGRLLSGDLLAGKQIIIIILFALLIFVMILSLKIGRFPVDAGEILEIVTSTVPFEVHDPDDFKWVVIEIVRLPRIILVVLAGMGLAMAGAAMQGVFRNPLVGPEVTGVSAGAAFGGSLAIVWGLNGFETIFLAFIFGFFALAAAFAISRLAGRSGILGLILTGVILSSFFGAMITLLQFTISSEAQLISVVFWLMGSFSLADYERVAVMAGVMILAGGGLLGLSWKINLLSLGERDAAAIGVRTFALRWLIVAMASLIVACQVSVSGGVGWVGLVVPHVARMLVGPEHSRLLPASALIGGIYLLLMDNMARSLVSQEIPVGILTSVTGTPIFIFLFLRIRKKGWSHE